MINISVIAAQQESGRLFGTVTNADEKPLAGAKVIVINQVTTSRETDSTNSDGKFSFRLTAGAYRLSVELPYAARFDRSKTAEYGKFANLICDETKKKCEVLENILISAEAETKIDFQAEEQKPTEITSPNAEESPGLVGEDSVKSATQIDNDRREVRDRWRIGFPEYDRYGDRGGRGRDIPFKRNRWFDPYNQSVIKGDYPIFGNEVFMVFSAVSTSGIEIRRTPAPTNVSSADPDSNNFFGRPESLSFNETVQLSFEMFKGDSTFRPRDWAIKFSPTFSVPNYLNARENGIVNIDVRRGTNRTDLHASLDEAFGEVKLFDVNKNYDFVSVRAGIQPFVSDFRGFIYSDNNLGVRLFGGFSNNKSQFNFAYFRQFEKDTNSGLNSLKKLRKQNVYIANFFRQDFLYKGYTIQASALYNDDRADVRYDGNGFLVRPTLVGDARPHSIRAGYVGINGDGHIGILNLTNSYYFAFGEDTFNSIAGRRTQIRAQMAAVEASIDRDYLRFRAAVFYASGDKNPTDDRATGFDAILDDPNFVGGQFSYWNRQGIRLISTEVGLVQSNSLLPSLRSSKIQGQANFVNPGIQIYNAGVDVEVTQTLKAIFNVNYLRFDRTESLAYLLFRPRVRHEIGLDYSLGVTYRPLLINNISFTVGGAIFQPGRGFRDIFTDRSRNCPPIIINFCSAEVPNPSKLQYQLFAQLKLIY
ncbi:MAG: carboxypeptidase-like regulatory domain-containing protein [Pyrinomonadaceae bacterium]|nr:carboxypeptidase-like regulatory domain-containing protein [Pyrinomonadaceae bacterium]